MPQYRAEDIDAEFLARHFKAEHGLQARLGEHIGIDRSTVGKMALGKRRIRVEEAIEIARFLNERSTGEGISRSLLSKRTGGAPEILPRLSQASLDHAGGVDPDKGARLCILPGLMPELAAEGFFLIDLIRSGCGGLLEGDTILLQAGADVTEAGLYMACLKGRCEVVEVMQSRLSNELLVRVDGDGASVALGDVSLEVLGRITWMGRFLA